MFDPREFIENLVLDGYSREDAVQLAKAEAVKRKNARKNSGVVSENDYKNHTLKQKKSLNLKWQR